MSTNEPFKMSQGYNVLVPKSGGAYPVPCNEWDFLKKKIRELSQRPWVFHTVGSILLGAALSTLIAIIVGGISATTHPNAEVVAWAVVVTGAVCGAVCLFFADQQNRMHRIQADDIVTQMELVEQRFERRTA
jgi:hypothetical protein